MWEPDQRRMQDGKLPNAEIVNGVPGILPSPTELLLVIAWITSGDSGYLQTFDIACDWTVAVDLQGKSHFHTQIYYPRIPFFPYASSHLCRHIAH